MTTHTLAYLRVSTERQESDGYGLDAQCQAVKDFAAAHDLPPPAAYSDALSGTVPPAGRPGFSDLITRLTPVSDGPGTSPLPDAGKPGDRSTAGNGSRPAVILPRLDRLARDLVVQELCLDALWSAGAVIWDASTGERVEQTAEPTRVLIRHVLGAVAQYDRAAIVARMAAGKAAKRRAGAYAGDGPPPYGWRTIAGALRPDDHEQAGLARARELRAMGLSLRAIGESLLIEGYRPRRAQVWHARVVRDLLRRPLAIAGAACA
jgi:DNA invertase Pin-like site-specific DNA recombinase